MFSERHRGVILQFVATERVVRDPSAVSASGKSSLHGNCGRCAQGSLITGLANKLEAGFIDGFGIHDLRVADLKLVFGVHLMEPQRLEIEPPDAIV